MHLIDIQFLIETTTNLKGTDMHDLRSIYRKVRKTLKSTTKDYFDSDGNYREYPNPPLMSDLDIISLTITAECLQITSECLLWSKLKKDYPGLFPKLIHRASYNRRKKTLPDAFLVCTEFFANRMVGDDESFILDSIPIPTCKIIREKRSRACRRPEYDDVVANKGFHPMVGGYFMGYKMHVITTESGVYRDLLLTSGSRHDSVFLKVLNTEDTHLSKRELIGDRGYIGQDTQLRLFNDISLLLEVRYRRNKKDYKKYDPAKKAKRTTIEVVFSQYYNEFGIRQTYAKRFNGFEIRIISKISAKTFKQYWNFTHGRKINQTKHALAA